MERNSQLTNIAFSFAESESVPEIQDLLRSVDLPAEDVEEHRRHFLIARDQGVIVGVVGLEVRGDTALLRSLAVKTGMQGNGLGKELYERILAYARSIGVRELGLLTTTAEGFFAKAGFAKKGKDDIPEYVTLSKEFRIYCPSSAVCMTKTIA